MGTIKDSTWMLKWNFISLIANLLIIFLLSSLCYFLYDLISEPIIRSTADVYLKRDIQSWQFSNFIRLLILLYLIHVVVGLFFNNKNDVSKLIVRTILSVIFVWIFASAYRTFNILILLKDQFLYVFYIPLLIGGVIMPFSEFLISTVIQKMKNKNNEKVLTNPH